MFVSWYCWFDIIPLDLEPTMLFNLPNGQLVNVKHDPAMTKRVAANPVMMIRSLSLATGKPVMVNLDLRELSSDCLKTMLTRIAAELNRRN